ncbi:MAG: DUF1524 domain-containing protein [Mycobacteriales bacterium]
MGRLRYGGTLAAGAVGLLLASSACRPASAPVAASPQPVASSPGAPVREKPRPASSTAARPEPVLTTLSLPTSSWALRLLGTVAVKGRAPKTGYSRAQFGQGWKDTDHNGCDSRNDVLRRDLHDVTLRGSCVVVSGVLDDPYTGQRLSFSKAQAAAVQIDHVVSLSDAWQTGAAGWTPYKRVQLANDLRELRAVGASVNDAKSDADAASWLPPDKRFRCAFVTIQTQVKAAYGLWMTPAEHDAIARVLTRCAGGTPAPAAVTPAPAAHQDPRFSSCRQARAAGYGPYVRGRDPEYAWYRDGDGDGTVCE